MQVFRAVSRFIKVTGEIERGSTMRDCLNDLHDELPSAENAMVIDRLDAEELEPVIAPGLRINHDETFLPATELEAEELEPVIAPGGSLQHAETFVVAELAAEELETVIAPGYHVQHPEAFALADRNAA
jgi:hypothetical protein